MKEFFVGLLALLVLMLLSVAGFFLLPLIVVMGFFLKTIIFIALIIFSIWLVGKITLLGIDYLRNKETTSQ